MQHVADDGDDQVAKVLLVVPDREEIEQALRRVGMAAVARIDDVDVRALHYRNGLVLDRDKERKQQDRKLDEALAQLVGVIGQSHQGLMSAMSKPRKAVIHRDPRTGKVIGASSVSED